MNKYKNTSSLNVTMFDTEITNEKLIVSIYGDGKIGEGAANDKKTDSFHTTAG